MTHFTTGLYKSPSDAASAVQLLEQHGVRAEDISLVASDDFDRNGFHPKSHSKATEGFFMGAAGGGAIGALIAGLTAVQVIATGGAGLGLLVAGPLMASLIGGGAGAMFGSAVGGMIGAAIPEKEWRYYEAAIREGSVLIGVRTDGNSELVKKTLEQSGAEKVTYSKSSIMQRLVENDADAKLHQRPLKPGPSDQPRVV